MASINRLVEIGRLMKSSEKFMVARTADFGLDHDTPATRRAQWKAKLPGHPSPPHERLPERFAGLVPAPALSCDASGRLSAKPCICPRSSASFIILLILQHAC